jgi:hypothetical protein
MQFFNFHQHLNAHLVPELHQVADAHLTLVVDDVLAAHCRPADTASILRHQAVVTDLIPKGQGFTCTHTKYTYIFFKKCNIHTHSPDLFALGQYIKVRLLTLYVLRMRR